MKGLAITSKGIEDICTLEIKELIKVKTNVKESCVIFDFKNYEELCLLCYKAQSVNKILLLIDNFKIKKIKDIKIKGIEENNFFNKKTFRVSSIIINNDINSQELNSYLGAEIVKKFNKKVDLNNPDVIFFVYVFKDECYLGIDFSGFSLHKRSYKIFNHPVSLRGTIAYALVRLAGYNTKETLLDCFMGAGTIPIEAGLYISSFPVNYYDKEKFAFLKFFNYDFKKIDNKMKLNKANIIGYDSAWLYVNNAKKNAKIAGINKLISLSRLEVEWLDTKFDKEAVDKIITQPPQITKNTNPKDIEKIYNELFYQAEFILTNKGRIVLISRKTEELKKFAEKHKFKLKEEREVYSGKEVLRVLVFGK